MRVTTAIAAVRIATETATAETATAIETCDATVRGIRAGTAAPAATIRVRTTGPDNQNVARISPEPRARGRTRYPAKSKHFGRTKRLVLRTRRPDPTNRHAPINHAAKASDPPTSAASEEDEAVADAVAADAMAAKTARMVRDRTQVTRARATPQVRAMETSASAHRCRRPRRLPASAHLLSRHPSNRCVIRLLHAPPRRRRRRRARARARERTTNTSCGPRPRAMFSALARTNGNPARAVLAATPRSHPVTRPQGRVSWRSRRRKRGRQSNAIWLAQAVAKHRKRR
jgi:hypothetical protein